MQTQDAPAEIIFRLWPWLEANKNRLIGVGVGIILASGVWYFISSQRAEKEVDAGIALSSVIVTPQAGATGAQLAAQLEQVGAKYAGTAAAERAQLQAAAALFSGGSYPEAQAQFQKFLNENSASSLAVFAQLGLAASLEAQNKPDQLAAAAAAYQRVVSAYSTMPACVQMADLALGRIAEQQNKFADAAKHYDAAARAVPGGSLYQEAMIRASELQPKLAAAPKAAAKPAVSPVATPAKAPTK